MGNESELVERLLRPEHVAYTLAWREIVDLPENPRVAYNAIGPDLCTVLLTTDASEVIGIERQFFSLDKLKTLLDDWDGLTIHENNKRKKGGYWPYSSIFASSFEGCLGMELKNMGVKRDSIEIKGIAEKPELYFEWNGKPRQVVYHIGTDISYPRDLQRVTLTDIDCFYQKSASSANPLSSQHVLKELPFFLKNDGVVLIGHPLSESYPGTRYDLNNLDPRFQLLSPPKQETERMALITGPYGWQLNGFRKMVK